MRTWSPLLLALLGCATVSPARSDLGAGEPCDALDECVVLACEGEHEMCGVFSCGDLESGVALQLERVQFRPPPRAPPRSVRNWRRVGLKPNTPPRAVLHFRYRYGYLPAFPRAEGKLVKHHLFSQTEELAGWFKGRGIDIHAWTMLIPETVHKRIHSGGPRGGEWNQAWRAYRLQLLRDGKHLKVSKEELLAQAFKMAYQFDILGPIVPYRAGVLPPGPQLFAAPVTPLPLQEPEPPVLAQ